jgi:outer membrane immunogenic protein
MRKIVLGVLLSVALAPLCLASAFAADMPVKATPAAVVAQSWTGLYVGGHIGAGWMNDPSYDLADPNKASVFTCGPCTAPYSIQALSRSNDAGFLGGIHAGYNWQIGQQVVGIEGDWTWTDITATAFGPLFSNAGPALAAGLATGPVPGSAAAFSTQVNWLASLRARVGGLINNQYLVYFTGGVAWADVDLAASASCLPPAIAGGCFFNNFGRAAFSSSTTRTGYVFGAGVEGQFGPHWRARVEYLFYGFNSEHGYSTWVDPTLPGAPGVPCITPTVGSCTAGFSFLNNEIQTIKVGLTYAF